MHYILMMVFVWENQAFNTGANQTSTATMVVEFNDLASCQRAGKAMAESIRRHPSGWACAAKGEAK